VIHAPAWGGLHGICERVGPLCAEYGWPWTIAIPPSIDGTRERFERAGLRVFELPLRRIQKTVNPAVHLDYILQAPLDIVRLKRLIGQLEADLVQICGLIHYQAAFSAALTKRPLVWQLHSDFPPPWMRTLFSPLVRQLADVVMTAGTRLVETHPGLERLGDRLVPFFSPIDTTKFRPDPERRRQVRARLGLGQEALVIGTVGNRGRQKNHQMAVRAAAALLDRHPQTEFLIIGQPVDSQQAWYQTAVIEELARLPAAKRARIRLIVPDLDILDYMSAFDIFILTSIAEGSPLVIAEAMAMALPVVSTEVGSIRDSVIDGETGFLVEPEGIVALVDRLERLIGSPELREQLGRAGRKRAKDYLDVHLCAEAHVSAYERATAHRQGNGSKSLA
jgi:glycosyltransferase involved in cell wall biosynthesis